ncbi:MAG: hypothetical protein L0099_02850 [Acidobacteria bacterium]|nr:hypothetical protein [Acidobacteriota bacterium]
MITITFRNAACLGLLAALLRGVLLCAQVPEPRPLRNVVVRLPVAHLHDAAGAACYGHLYFSRDRIRYRVAKPRTAAAHALDFARADVEAAEQSTGLELRTKNPKQTSKAQRFALLPPKNAELGRHTEADVLPATDLLAPATGFAVLAGELDSGGQRPRGAPALSVTIQKFTTDPGGIEVLVDGFSWGATDLETGEIILYGLPFGERSFVMRKRGYEVVRFPVRYEHERTGETYVAMKALSPGARGGGLLLEDVLDMLEGDVPPARVAVLVKEKGVSFALTGAAEKRIRNAGGDDALLLAIARARK